MHLPQAKELMIPPPLKHPCPWALIRRQTQVQNGPGRNVLCNHVMATGDVGLHLL